MEDDYNEEYLGGSISNNGETIAIYTNYRLILVPFHGLEDLISSNNFTEMSKQSYIRGIVSVCFYSSPLVDGNGLFEQYIAVATKESNEIQIYDDSLTNVWTLKVPEPSNIVCLEADRDFPYVYSILFENGKVYQYNSYAESLKEVKSSNVCFPPLDYCMGFELKGIQKYCFIRNHLFFCTKMEENKRIFILYNLDTKESLVNDKIQDQIRLWNWCDINSLNVIASDNDLSVLVYYPSKKSYISNCFVEFNCKNNVMQAKVHEFDEFDLRFILKLKNNKILLFLKDMVIPYDFNDSKLKETIMTRRMKKDNNSGQMNQLVITQEMIDDLPKPINNDELDKFLCQTLPIEEFSLLDEIRGTINKTEKLYQQIQELPKNCNGIPNLFINSYNELRFSKMKLETLSKPFIGKKSDENQKPVPKQTTNYLFQYSGFIGNDNI